MEIRKLLSDDIGGVINLYNNVRETIDNKFWFSEISGTTYTDLVTSGCLYGAFNEKNELVGVSALLLDGINYDIGDEFTRLDLKLGELGFFMVRDDCRGMGVLNQINMQLMEIAKEFGVNALCSRIHPTNFAAIRAFNKLGKLEFVSFYRAKKDYPRVVYGVRI